ncbi:hypothetical protein KDD30_05690 [Photobacterium sp. GJ3]|uniref:hypothetical protein n=1 Tax=Photobacterium sp. GJ3 TaxID=2829502 RepID=UPI001B8BC47E|nr:hypothetical protein [Photobacterium sp. GJ3]QUJ68604.1 hypothetical protein KDD30_05690 [Photobacterium sp. GJ3]
MVNKFLVILFFVVQCVSCHSEDIQPYKTYMVEYNNVNNGKVESVINEFSVRNNLYLYRKDESSMQYLSLGEPAFFNALYYQDDPVIVITNVGVSGELVITVTDYKKLPVSTLDGLATDLISILENTLSVEIYER